MLSHFGVRGKRKIPLLDPDTGGSAAQQEGGAGEGGGKLRKWSTPPPRGPVGEWKAGVGRSGSPEVRTPGSRAARNKSPAEGRAGGGKDPAASAAFAAGVVLPGGTRKGRLDSAATRATSESCSLPPYSPAPPCPAVNSH